MHATQSLVMVMERPEILQHLADTHGRHRSSQEAEVRPYILTYLADRPGEVIAKQELMDHVWSDVTVEEGSLRVHVAAIRKALGDGQFGNRYIANIKGRGYSFVGTVVRLEGSGSSSPNFRGGRPTPPLMLIGREATVSEVRDWIRQGRFVTLLGPGGIDKTTVAVAAGHDADVRLISALVHALKARR